MGLELQRCEADLNQLGGRHRQEIECLDLKLKALDTRVKQRIEGLSKDLARHTHQYEASLEEKHKVSK